MDIEYKFHCSGCSKPDKEFPVRFEDEIIERMELDDF